MNPLERVHEILETLIRFDTVSARSNMALIHWVRDYLLRHGVESTIVPNGEGTKANLYATLGPRRAGGVALSGHTDVVPVEGQAWSSEPFHLTRRDGRLYGRGTADMKGFIACALAAVPDFLAARLATPIHLAFSYDEEVGCIGVPHLLARLARDLPKPAVAIIGEPTMMRVVTGHKGLAAWRTIFTGVEAHSSRIEEAVSAIFAASTFIEYLRGLAAELRAGPRDPSFEPPFTTINVGKIAGGQAMNIVAGQCTLDWEFRPLPGVDYVALGARIRAHVEGELRPALKKKHPGADVELIQLAGGPGLMPEPDSKAEALARRLTGSNRSGTVAYGTEAGLFQRTGISSVVCGPGDIEQAHKPDEFVALDQLALCAAFLAKLKDWAAGSPEF
ncbi:MAG: acetylornithine deacetylase [Alphaproteobacteria bacterium]